jgi:hypothetical protein
MKRSLMFMAICLLVADTYCTRAVAAGTWMPLGSGTDARVTALGVWSNQLLVGGLFNAPGNHLATWNGSAWSSLGAGMDGPVQAFAAYNNQLIAGGRFTASGSISLKGIAAWDGTTWSPLESGLSGAETATAYSLCVFQDQLFVGGAYDQAGSVAASCIASWNGSSWSPLGSGTGGSSPYVYALTVFDNQLIAGGHFTSPASYIAAWNGSSWLPLASGFDGEVRALTTYNGLLIAGGVFTAAGTVSLQHIAMWDGSSWLPLGSGVNGNVQALAVYNGHLIAAGEFTIAGEHPANHVAEWDGTSWSPLGTGMNGLAVFALSAFEFTLIAGGEFTQASNAPASNIAYLPDAGLCKFGYGLKFDGVNDYVALPLTSLNNMPQGTVEAWVKFKTLSSPDDDEQFILTRSKNDGAWRGDLRLAKGRSGFGEGHRFYFSLDNGVTRLFAKSAPIPNIWTHVAGSWDGSYWRIYVNGILEDSLSNSLVLLADSQDSVLLGCIRGTKPGYYHGALDETRISNVVRTPAEFCLKSECTSDDNTVALWHFNESSGDTVFDATGNNNHGILNGVRRNDCSYLCGDANYDATVDISDVVYLIAYIFSGGLAPEPLEAGDANCDQSVDISDVVYLIAYIFGGGAAPCALCK